jgi:predicted Na+-dependent transporter
MTMDLKSHDILTRLRWPIYFIAMGLTVIPLLDFGTSVLPIDAGNLRWRWSTLGLFTGFLFTPLFAIILVCFIASQLEDRVTQRVVSILNLVAAPVILGMLLKYGFAFICFLWLGIAGFRASKAVKSSREARRGEATPLVSGVGSVR